MVIANRPTRILLLGPLGPPYGGPEVMTALLLEGLVTQPSLAIKHVNMQVSRSLADKGGKRQIQKSLLAMVQALKVIGHLVAFRPDILYMPLTNSPSFLGFVRDSLFVMPALLLGRKVVVRLHGGYYFYVHTTGLKRRFVHALFSRMSLVMVQGQKLAGIFDGFVARERVVIIPNGIDDAPLAAVRNAGAKRSGTARPVVLFVGLMCAEKGIEEVVHAIPSVPDADFVFLGEWPSEADAQRAMQFLEAAGAADRATFRGVLSGREKWEAFLSADVFVFPSYFPYEGHAVSSVEAVAAGLAMVCTDHGALGESLRDGWNGYFVPPHDSAAVAARVNQLVGNDALRAQMRQRSRELYLERFTIGQFIDAWVRAIQQCARVS